MPQDVNMDDLFGPRKPGPGDSKTERIPVQAPSAAAWQAARGMTGDVTQVSLPDSPGWPEAPVTPYRGRPARKEPGKRSRKNRLGLVLGGIIALMFFGILAIMFVPRHDFPPGSGPATAAEGMPPACAALSAIHSKIQGYDVAVSGSPSGMLPALLTQAHANALVSRLERASQLQSSLYEQQTVAILASGVATARLDLDAQNYVQADRMWTVFLHGLDKAREACR